MVAEVGQHAHVEQRPVGEAAKPKRLPWLYCVRECEVDPPDPSECPLDGRVGFLEAVERLRRPPLAPLLVLDYHLHVVARRRQARQPHIGQLGLLSAISQHHVDLHLHGQSQRQQRRYARQSDVPPVVCRAGQHIVPTVRALAHCCSGALADRPGLRLGLRSGRLGRRKLLLKELDVLLEHGVCEGEWAVGHLAQGLEQLLEVLHEGPLGVGLQLQPRRLAAVLTLQRSVGVFDDSMYQFQLHDPLPDALQWGGSQRRLFAFLVCSRRGCLGKGSGGAALGAGFILTRRWRRLRRRGAVNLHRHRPITCTCRSCRRSCCRWARLSLSLSLRSVWRGCLRCGLGVGGGRLLPQPEVIECLSEF
mmetsp:Transcript_44998/g.127025  ORF Transcript_44998/g.127025 Transcript_44998/m.127025 type:complete len:362 (+) Transcript_44998:1577-2662(+)